ncbi:MULTISPECIES: sugar ABC transporter permease [Paenibacillus]|uniref:ABC transporter permease n=1 Tax=Paenibacillus TaxID=44249 RepID=UPI000B814D3E|nr:MULTISPECIES: ABC transporter permease subunit [Paenibacillus]MBD8837248.1 sugar ABC transporter permease [Paenibacillus sp. CFBP 13594]PRA07517.1 sugar ABC transporter permease [Paenibacillus sp. MYb63]PRA51162.1 sugar ABC transporter permease [Paenibacillus sp. MYb67]QZN74289.1 ABC transporter permease subunit [Paenibacillus sp. DR312]
MLRKWKQQRAYHLMLIPSLVLVFIFSYIPFYGLIIAFQKYNPGLGFNSPWVGWDNFTHIFNQPNFVRTIWNTLYMSVFKIIGGIIVPVIFALLLNEVLHSGIKRTFQTLVYIPNFLSWVIMAGIMLDILSSDGIINTFLSVFGIAPISFLGTPSIFPWTMIVSDIWKGFGFGTVVYLAALTSIDPGLYEAAVIDGAKRWKQTIYITLPLLMPTIVLMTVLSLGNVLNAGFDQIYNLYSPVVYQTGDIIDTYVYRLGIQQAQYSIGTAVGLFKSIISSVLVAVSYILAYRVAGYRIF